MSYEGVRLRESLDRSDSFSRFKAKNGTPTNLPRKVFKIACMVMPLEYHRNVTYAKLFFHCVVHSLIDIKLKVIATKNSLLF